MLSRLRSSSVPGRFSLPLVLLCIVQACERFAFLAMLPLFVQYLHRRHGIPESMALLVLGVWQALSYLGGLPAGWLADRKLGAGAATAIGATLLVCAYSGLALDRPALLWPALLVMAVGQSLFRSNLHVLIGGLELRRDDQRERAFLWHYLAVNLGYATGALFGEWALARGWSMVFGGAAIASVIASGTLAITLRCLRGASAKRSAHESLEESAGSTTERMQAVWLICGAAVIFWLTAQQAGSSLALFAAANTVTQVAMLGRSLAIGPGHFAALHGLLVLAMLPAVLAMNSRQRTQARTSAATKMVWGYVATAAAFVLMAAASLHGKDAARVGSGWLVGCYALLSIGEVLLAPLGVSLLTQLAPKNRAGQAVGLWFAATTAGNALAGLLGLGWERWPHHLYFAVLALLSLGAAAVLLARLRQITRLTARSLSVSLQPVPSGRMESMTPVTSSRESSLPNSTPSTSSLYVVLASLAILLTVPIFVVQRLPLHVRGIGAIACGIAVLLCGSYLVGQGLDFLVHRAVARNS